MNPTPGCSYLGVSRKPVLRRPTVQIPQESWCSRKCRAGVLPWEGPVLRRAHHSAVLQLLDSCCHTWAACPGLCNRWGFFLPVAFWLFFSSSWRVSSHTCDSQLSAAGSLGTLVLSPGRALSLCFCARWYSFCDFRSPRPPKFLNSESWAKGDGYVCEVQFWSLLCSLGQLLRLSLLVSFLSGITQLNCLLSSVWKTIVLHILLSFLVMWNTRVSNLTQDSVISWSTNTLKCVFN